MPSEPCADRFSAGHGIVTLYTPISGPAAAHTPAALHTTVPPSGSKPKAKARRGWGTHGAPSLTFLATFGTQSAE